MSEKHGGVNVMELIKLMAPVIGGVAGGDPGYFMGGYMKQQALMDEQRAEQAQTEQRMKATGANFMVELGKLAHGAKTPAEFHSTMDFARQAYTHAGYGPAEDLNSIQFDQAGMDEEERKKALAALDQLVKLNGPDILDANVVLDYGGHKISPRALQALAGQSATDATTGAPYKPTPKPAGSMDERAASLKTQIRAATAAGDTKKAAALQAQYDDLVTTTRDMRAPVDPTGSIEALRQLQLNKPPTEPRQRFTVQPITLPDGTTGLVRVNMDTGETTRVDLPEGAGSGRASDTQRLSAAYFDRTQKAQQNLTPFEAQLVTLGPQADVQFPNLLQSEQGQLYSQARDEFINAALRRESGAAIQPSEYARYDKIYFVQPGDKPANIKQKQAARERIIKGFKVAAGNLGQTTPTGPTIGEKRMINGKPAEWDGKGWKAVQGAAGPLPVKSFAPVGGL